MIVTSALIVGEANLARGPVASWSVRSPLDRAVRVRTLAEDIALCSWERSLTVPLFTPVSLCINGYRRV